MIERITLLSNYTSILQQSIQKLQEEAARLGQSQMLLAVRARVLGLRLIVGRIFVTTYSFAAQQWNKLNSFSIKVWLCYV